MSDPVALIAFIALVVATGAAITYALDDLQNRLTGAWYPIHTVKVACPTCNAKVSDPCVRDGRLQLQTQMHGDRHYRRWHWKTRDWVRYGVIAALYLAGALACIAVLIALVEDRL